MSETAARKLEIALDLADLGIELYETKIRREYPALTDREVAERVATWLGTRPGAEHGDAEGVPAVWPRPGASGK